MAENNNPPPIGEHQAPEEPGQTIEPRAAPRGVARDPNLGAAVGGYRNQRRPGWYMALVLLGVSMGALLALVVGEAPPPAEDTVGGVQLGTARPDSPDLRTGLVFATTEQAPKATPHMIPAGTKRVYCHFRLPDVDRIDALVGAWKHDGEPGGTIPAGSFKGAVEGGFAVGRAAIDAPGTQGFAKGIYEVELTTGEGDVYDASFIVVEKPDQIMGQKIAAAPGVQISQATVCGDVTGEGAPQATSTVFPPNAGRIYMAFKFASAQPGSVVRVRWLYRDQAIESATREITLESESGWAYAWISPDAGTPLLEGAYRVVVEAVPDGEQLATAAFEVKAGS